VPDLGSLLAGLLGPLLAMIFIVVPLVAIHELGHLIAARWRGIAIDEFGIGFPPRIATIARRGRLAITLNALPVGGFVRMAGTEEGSDEPEGWERASLRSKVLVMLAGILANLFLAFVLLSIVAGPLAERGVVVVGNVQVGSPASAAGIQTGDRIIAINGLPFERMGGSPFAAHVGEKVLLSVERDGATSVVSANLRGGESALRNGILGISIREVAAAGRFDRSLVEAMSIGASDTVASSVSVLSGLGAIVTAPFSGGGTGLTGPIGIAVSVSEAAGSIGVAGLLRFAGILSANLAVLNLLPIPPLDGGRIAGLLLRRALGGRRGKSVERRLILIGAVAMLALFAVVTFGDLVRIFSGQG
jgi:regulator of sigma E protease